MNVTAVLLACLLQAPPAPGDLPGADAPPPSADSFQPDPAWKPLGKELWFDPARKRVVLRAAVCLREGYLEHLLCRRQSKEHESILVTDAEPRMIHAALLLTGAEPGHPVRFQPAFESPTGTAIRIDLEWNGPDGKPRTADARSWVQDDKTKKPLARNWVFAGSDLFKDPDSDRMIYAADSGDLFTVSNFTNAILDVPFASSTSDAERSFIAATDRIPPVDTKVTLFLQPETPASPGAPTSR